MTHNGTLCYGLRMSLSHKQVRLPGELSVQVEELAEHERRSVSQMTAILVEEALSRRGTPEPVSPRTVVLPERQFMGPDPK